MLCKSVFPLLLISWLSAAATVVADDAPVAGGLEPHLGLKGRLLLEEKFDGNTLPEGNLCREP